MYVPNQRVLECWIVNFSAAHNSTDRILPILQVKMGELMAGIELRLRQNELSRGEISPVEV